MTDIFDKDELMERLDGDIEFLAETVEILEEDGPSLIEELRAAAAEADAERIAQAAHAIKGMVSNFCAQPAIAAAKHVEEMGRKTELDGVDEQVQLVVFEIDRLKIALGTLLKGV